MSQNNKFFAQGVPFTPFSDGFGGMSAMYFASPVETLPRLPPPLGEIPQPPIPKRVYGGTGVDATPVHGMSCTAHGCGFSGPSEKDVLKHALLTHGSYHGMRESPPETKIAQKDAGRLSKLANKSRSFRDHAVAADAHRVAADYVLQDAGDSAAVNPRKKGVMERIQREAEHHLQMADRHDAARREVRDEQGAVDARGEWIGESTTRKRAEANPSDPVATNKGRVPSLSTGNRGTLRPRHDREKLR